MRREIKPKALKGLDQIFLDTASELLLSSCCVTHLYVRSTGEQDIKYEPYLRIARIIFPLVYSVSSVPPWFNSKNPGPVLIFPLTLSQLEILQ